MENKKIAFGLIIVLLVMILLIVGFMSYKIVDFKKNGSYDIFKFSFNFNDIGHYDNVVFDKTYDNNFDKIIIDSYVSDIYVRESTDDNFKVVVNSESENDITSNVDDSTLNIKMKERKYRKIPKIELYLPRSYNSSVIINNKAGDIKVDDYLLASFEIDNYSGDVKINNCNRVDINNKSGDIKIAKAEQINIVSKSGDISINKTDLLMIDSTTGDIKIDSVDNKFDIKSKSGDVQINTINIKQNSSIKNQFGDISINSTNKIRINADIGTGDSKINNNWSDSSIILDIDSKCGDLDINN